MGDKIEDQSLTNQVMRRLIKDNQALRIALHDAIRRPMGVVPASAEDFYMVDMADQAEARRVEQSRERDIKGGYE